MKVLYYPVIISILLFCTCLSVVAQISVSKGVLQSRLDSILTDKTEYPFNGVVLVVQDDSIIYQRKQGLSDKEVSERIDWDSYFVIGSISKQITAYLILQEYSKGTLKLNESILTYLPRLTEYWANEVTIHHLLTHTHGITELDKPLSFLPGSQFAYSQIGYKLLADILESVRKDSFANISAELFVEVGMEHTFHPDLFHDRKLVKAYNNKWEEVKDTVYVAAGGFISTARDLLIWNQYLFDYISLEINVLEKMFRKQENAVRNHPLFGITYYGYGITIDDTNNIKQYGQTGYVQGFPCMSYYYPRYKLTVIMLQNIDYGESLREHFSYHLKTLEEVKEAMQTREIKPIKIYTYESVYKEQVKKETFYTDTIKVNSNNFPIDSLTYYFPTSFFTKIKYDYDYSDPFTTKIIPRRINDEINHFVLEWYSSQLYAMNEPLLFNKRTNKEIYRFTWLRTFHNPIAITIEKDNHNYTLSWKVCDGAGGYNPGKIVVDKSRKITKSDWDRFQNGLIESKFWSTNIAVEDEGLDGAEWIIEGVLPDNYNVLRLWSPVDVFYDLGMCLLSMTDLDIPDNEIY